MIVPRDRAQKDALLKVKAMEANASKATKIASVKRHDIYRPPPSSHASQMGIRRASMRACAKLSKRGKSAHLVPWLTCTTSCVSGNVNQYV